MTFFLECRFGPCGKPIQWSGQRHTEYIRSKSADVVYEICPLNLIGGLQSAVNSPADPVAELYLLHFGLQKGFWLEQFHFRVLIHEKVHSNLTS